MRDFESSEIQSRLAYGQVTWLVRLVKNWRMRKHLKALQHFSDYQMRDIGLSRGELNYLIRLPLDMDVSWDLERRKFLQCRFESQANRNS
jgi:uncharacterized protein YjiS (DUF1127 family)